MANINLSRNFRNNNDIVSPVDTRIKLNKNATDQVVYSDLKLDLDTGEILERPLNAIESSLDLQRITDEECIVTSVRNLLATNYGDRLLNPDIHIDLRSYLFEPLTQSKAYFMAYEIFNSLPKYEPRVTISNIEVTIDSENACYLIDMSLTIPSINKDLKIKSILSSTSYSIDV